MPPLTLQLGASTLESFYEGLRLVGIDAQSRRSIHGLRQPGILKKYLEAKLVISLHFDFPAPANEFRFVFYRIPSGCKNTEILHPAPSNGWIADHADLPLNGQANRVFTVGDSSERSHNVVASGIGVRSRIWLFGRECTPEPLINPSCLQEHYQVSGALRPREINRPIGRPGGYISGREGGLVESILGIAECFGSLPSSLARNISAQSQLLNVLAGIRIDLGNDFCNVRLEEATADGVKLRNCVLCPTDRIARWREMSLNRIESHLPLRF